MLLRWIPCWGMKAFFVGIACLFLLAFGPRRIMAADGLSDLTGPWQLFVDDYAVAAKDGVTRTYHAFEKYAGNPVLRSSPDWEGGNIYLYGTVLPNESGPGYRMWYHSLNFNLPTNRVHAHYAYSEDGISWTKPELGIVSLNGSTLNNIFIEPGNCPSVMHTPWDAGIQQAYKIMRGGGSGQFAGAVSADAIHWTEDTNALCPKASDVCTFNWDPHTRQYMGFPKVGAVVNGLGRRATGVWATSSFESWPAPRRVLAPDSWDDRWVLPGSTQATHFYGLCGFAYESMYVGFLWILRVTGKVSGADDGPIFVEIVTSHDGVHWQREEGERPPILPLGPDGAWDDGMVFTATHPLVEGDTLRLYYGGFNSTHADEGAWTAAIGMATLRKDGFASLDAGSTPGVITTKRILGVQGPLHVNCSVASSGSLSVEVLDANGVVIPGYEAANCNTIQGDHVDQVVAWGSQTELPATADPVRLRFVLQDASLYSFALGDAVQFQDEPSAPTLAVLYDFELTAGHTVKDRLLDDGGQDPAFAGDVWVDPHPAFAAFGEHSAAFGYGESTPNTLTIPASTNLGTHFTLAAMVNSASGESGRIFSTPSVAWGTAHAGLFLDYDPSGLSNPGLRLTCKGMEVSSQTLNVGAGEYHHVAVTYDDGEVSLYVDGAPVGHDYISAGDPVVLPGDLGVGSDAASVEDGRFTGYIDDVVVTGRTLSAEEIASLAEVGASVFFGVARVSSDFDRDGDVDQVDLEVFQGCLNGPNLPSACADVAGTPQTAGAAKVKTEASETTTGAPAPSISFIENWDSYAVGSSDPAYVERWDLAANTTRYQIDTTCPSSSPNNLRVPKGGPCIIAHNLVPDLEALVPGAVEVIGTNAFPLVLAYSACLRDGLAFADVIVELSQGDVHAPGTDSATSLPVLAFGMASAIHGSSSQPWFFDGQYWHAANVLDTSKSTNILTMQVKAGAVVLSGGAGSVTQTRTYTGGFDRITIRTQTNSSRARFLDDIQLTGGQVIRGCTTPLTITSITPTTGRGDERLVIQVNGSGFLAGFTTVKLVQDGQTAVTASTVNVAADEQSLTCAFDLDLHKAVAGVWDLEVSVPHCSDAVAPAAVTVTSSMTHVMADLDNDGDVDLDDFGIFQRCYSGEGKPADPNCAN